MILHSHQPAIIPIEKRISLRIFLTKKLPLGSLFYAGGRGVEPLLTAPEAAVLPLDEPPIQRADFTMRGKIRLAKRVCAAHLCYNGANKNLNTKSTKKLEEEEEEKKTKKAFPL